MQLDKYSVIGDHSVSYNPIFREWQAIDASTGTRIQGAAGSPNI